MCTRSPVASVVASAVIVVAVSVATAAGEVRYAITEIGPTAYGNALPFGINDRGQVVGQRRWPATAGQDTAFLYDYRQSTMTDLGTLGGTRSTAVAINDFGQAAGMASLPYNSSTRSEPYQGVVWGADGTKTSVYPFEPSGINDTGAMSGKVLTSPGIYHAAVYQGGQATEIAPLPGGWDAVALGINDAGQVAGFSRVPSGYQHALVYDVRGGKITDLGTLGGANSFAMAINDRGQVTGYAGVANNDTHAFLYAGGVMQDLGQLGGLPTYGSALNDWGQVVGYAAAGGWLASDKHPFLYQNGVMTDLNTLIDPASGWHLLDARGINDRGQIIGTGQSPSGAAQAAFILTPLAGGDVNADGRLDVGDYALIDRGYARGLVPGQARWADGDLDGDGAVGASDYLVIDAAYARQQGALSPDLLATREAEFGEGYVAELAASVPEPTSLGLGVAAMLGLSGWGQRGAGRRVWT
jgi:probable HAF family extracellular repeat protein